MSELRGGAITVIDSETQIFVFGGGAILY